MRRFLTKIIHLGLTSVIAVFLMQFIYLQSDLKSDTNSHRYFTAAVQRTMNEMVIKETIMKIRHKQANVSSVSRSGYPFLGQPVKLPSNDWHSKPIPLPQSELRKLPPLKYNPDHFFQKPYQPLLYGRQRKYQGFLTIGIPTIRRPNTDQIYLFDTINSLLEKLKSKDRDRVTIVVMVADSNTTYNIGLADQLSATYRESIDSGLIHLVQPPPDIYPDLDTVRRTYNDPMPRIKWRAKQNIDYAFLMLYCKTLSEYYMQIEDDLLTAKGFLRQIENFIKDIRKKGTKWTFLEFSKLGFIGKLFRSLNLPEIANILLDNFDAKPCDLLLGDIRRRSGQGPPIHYNYSLFQHIGWYSSLENKLAPSLDKGFLDKKAMLNYLMKSKQIIGDNPTGTVKTSFTPLNGTLPEFAYDNNNTTTFNCMLSQGRTFVWNFRETHNFSRIVLKTGSPLTGAHTFETAIVEYSRHPQCQEDYRKLVIAVHGAVDTLVSNTIIPDRIKCIRLSHIQSQDGVLIIQDLQVFVKR